MLLKPKFLDFAVSATLEFWIFTKKLIFNLFQKSGMLLKPKFLDFAVSATLEFWIFSKKKKKEFFFMGGPWAQWAA